LQAGTPKLAKGLGGDNYMDNLELFKGFLLGKIREDATQGKQPL
jgi:hypothetical protein